MSRFTTVLTLALLLAAMAIPTSVSADDRLDYDVSGGHFFSQTNGSTLGPRAGGYAISDANGIPFWTYFNQQGGTEVLGYPVSTRFIWDGYVCQATQRAILQWNPETSTVQLANVFDYLSTVGKDDWLWSRRLVPKAQQSTQEAGATAQPFSFLQLAHFRFAWLYQDPAIFQRYFNTADYFRVYGLPTSPVEDLGPYYAARFQRAVIYHWKIPVPWADGNGVSVGLAGDLYKELGLIPAVALHPQTLAPTDPGVVGLPVAPAHVAAAPVVASANTSGLPVLVGVATWYGSDFQGQTMYNGRPYNMYNPHTTASNAYPMGTWLRVTRLSTGASILVQVTDRGAFRYPDIVDLSYAAFSELANPATGVIRVRVEPVS